MGEAFAARRDGFNWAGLSAVTAALLVAACGGVPLQQEAPLATAPAPATRAKLPVLPPAGSGRGGYYQDDGPGDAPPENLLAIPDAEPRVEPYGKRGNRPYVVFGKRYVPIVDEEPYKARGRGSWYGKKFHGQKTSSGEIYDMYKMTAAHPTLPLPSYARVTNLENGRQIIVRVNDRGPFLQGRIIDLSYTAALKLGYLQKGSAMLEVERLLPDEIERIVEQRKGQETTAVATSGGVDIEAGEVVQQAMPERVALAPVASPAVVQAANSANSTNGGHGMDGAPAAATVAATGIYLQLGAFGQAANADAARHRFIQHAATGLPAAEVVAQGDLYRVYSGPFPSRTEAEAAAEQLQRSGAFSPLIVQR